MALLPIYDRYDRATGWKKVLYVEDRVVQLPELNEAQSIAHDNLRQLGDVLFRDGSIVAGLQPVIDGSTCNITAGKLYWKGYILDIPAGSVPLTLGVQEKIGIRITEVFQTEAENTDLNDPVSGADNRGLPGAYRLTFDGVFTNNDDNAQTLHVLRFGEVVTNNVPPQFDTLAQTLALRTSEESGSYFVNGMDTVLEDPTTSYVSLFTGTFLDELGASVGISRLPSETDAAYTTRIVEGTIMVTVEAGVAYVEGFRIFKPSTTKILVPKARTLEFVNGEQQLVTGPHTLGDPLTIALNNGPINDISDVTVPVERSIGVIRSVAIASDFVPSAGPIVPPGPTTVTWLTYTYTQGVHFNFISGNTIQWLNPDGGNPDPAAPGGSSTGNPSLASVPRGQTYQVDFVENATLEVGTQAGPQKDVYISSDNEVTLTGSVAGVDVAYKTGIGAILQLDYHWVLDRIDTIFIDKNGDIRRQPGSSARFPVPAVPPVNTLSLTEVSLRANSTAAFASQRDVKLKRLTMRDLQDLKTRLDRSDYNQAQTNLNTQARLGVTNSVTLKGIFTDSFVNNDRVDLGNADYLANPITMDIVNGEITPKERTASFELGLNAGASANLKPYGSFDNFYVPSFTLTPSPITQPLASTPVKVNQYAAHLAVPFIDKMSPSFSNESVEGQTMTVTNTATGQTLTVPPNGFSVTNTSTTQTTTAQNIVFEGLAPFIYGPKVVRLIARDFPAGATNIALTMDGVGLNVIPDLIAPNGTTAGTPTSAGKSTVNAGTDGTIHCQFTIPASTIRSGRRPVTLSNGVDSATTVFTGNDILRQPVRVESTSERLVTTLTQNPPRDPVAQTFVFTSAMTANANDILVTGVELFFKAKPANADVRKTVTIQIRETIAGLPVSGFLTSKTYKPADIPNGSVTTNASQGFTVTFDDPVLCEVNREYAVVVLTDYPEWEIFTATLGASTVNTSPVVRIDQQASSGVLLTSANGNTWTPDQASDLTYTLYGGAVAPTATAQFNQVTFPWKARGLKLMAPQQVPSGGRTVWEYSTSNFAGGLADGVLDPTNTQLVSMVNAGANVAVRARMTNTSQAACMIQAHGLKLIGVTNAQTGVYVSATIPLEQAPTDIKASLDIFLPAGAVVNVEYGLVNPLDANDIDWTAMSLTSSVPTGNPGFSTYTYSSGAITTTRTNVKIRVTMECAMSGSDVVAVPRARRLIAILN